MAKEKVSKRVKATLAAPAPASEFKPRLYLSLEGQDVTQIKELKVGDHIQVLVEGTIKGLSQRERPDYDDPKKVRKSGDIDLEGYRVKVLEDEVDFAKQNGVDDD